MRADRLLSLLMLLQTRGKMSARALADELDVAVRTVYRDIDALSRAGVPIYSEAGRGGGYALVDRYRTTLTGLTEGEIRALFMLNIPAPLDELGVHDELRAAQLKLSAALPAARQNEEQRARQRLHFDAAWWQQGGERVPHLQLIHTAVWQDGCVDIVYLTPFATRIARRVAPYGLVAKAGVWYLVSALANGTLHVQRVSGLLEVTLTEERFERPPEFHLARFWDTWCREHEALLVHFTAVVRVAPDFVPLLAHTFGTHMLPDTAVIDDDGWMRLTLAFESFEAARDRLLGCGRGVEVLEPHALRCSIHDYAAQIVALYAASDVAQGDSRDPPTNLP